MIYNTYKGFKIWGRYYFEKLLPKEFYPKFIEYSYKQNIQKCINLKNPQNFSEKLNYLKIYDATPQKTLLSDKLLAKEYIKENIPDLATAKVYQIGTSFEELDFEKCPSKFIIKTNHACKTGRLIKNKNSITKQEYKNYKKYYKKVLAINYAFWGTLELQYKDIVPKVYTEEYLESNNPDFLINEYEVYCLNGSPEFIQYVVRMKQATSNAFYNPDWTIADFSLFKESILPNIAEIDPKKVIDYELFLKHKEIMTPPQTNRNRVLEYSKFLSKDFKFARIDFFEINNNLYFGEVTFTPFSGDIKFVPEEYDLILGKKLHI